MPGKVVFNHATLCMHPKGILVCVSIGITFYESILELKKISFYKIIKFVSPATRIQDRHFCLNTKL